MDYQQLISSIGQRVKQLRLEKKLTQLDLAAKCDMEQTNLARIERGKTGLTIQTLHKLAVALEVEVMEFFK